MKRLRWPTFTWWRTLALSLGSIALAVLLLTHELVALAPRLSESEAAAALASTHAVRIVDNPLDLPYKLLEYLTLKLPTSLVIQARLPSIVLAFVALGLATYMLHRWYGTRSTIFGLAIFGFSAWFLHVARFGAPEIEYFVAILALLAVHTNLHDNEEGAWAWFCWLGVSTALLFVPGLLWFVLLSAAWQWRAMIHAWSARLNWERVVSVSIPVVGVAAIVAATVRNHSLLFTWLGLPAHPILPLLTSLPHRLLGTLLLPVWNGPHQPELWLGQLPLLDGFLLAMLAVGTFFYVRHWKATRTHLLGGYLILGVFLVSLGVARISLLLPPLYLISVAGIAYILHRWLRVFPRNPIARGVGIGLISALVALSCYYNVTQYFIAWPHNTEVEQVYRTAP